MTESQENLIKHALLLAENAFAELGSKADEGTKARPTVKQINNTLDRLRSITRTLEAAL